MAYTGPTKTQIPQPKKPINVPLWTFIAIAGALAIILFLNTFNDDKGNPLFDTSLLTSSVSGTLLLAAAVGPSFIQNRRDTQTIKHEVKNDHSKNMRVEQDERYRSAQNSSLTIISQNEKLLAALERHSRKIDALDKKFDGKVDGLRVELRGDLTGIRDDMRQQDNRIDGVEKGLLEFWRGTIHKKGEDHGESR